MKQLENSEKAALLRLRAVLDVVRDVNPEMPAQTLQALVLVALEPNISMSDLEKRLGVSSAATSRIIARLSEWERHEVPGRNWLEQRMNPLDRRYRVVELKPKGMTLMKRIAAALLG